MIYLFHPNLQLKVHINGSISTIDTISVIPMKKMFFLLCLLLGSGTIGNLMAQSGYEVDALRYSQNTVSGSSRTQALGGAGVALGSDISAGNINPAGLGLYRKGEFSISSSLGLATTSTDFLRSTSEDSRIYFGIPNFGLVFTTMKDDLEEGKFRGSTFAISFNKTNNFQNQFSYSGMNTSNSIGEYFAERATGTPVENYNQMDSKNLESLPAAAYWSDIIDTRYLITNTGDTIQDPSRLYETTYLSNRQRQSESVLTRGGQYSWDFSYGGNYDNKLFFGLGLGLVRVNYYTEKKYNEDIFYDNNDSKGVPTNINIYDTYSTKGGGINLKGGLIYKPADFVRVGISAQTPTYYYDMRETGSTDFNSLLNDKPYPLTLRSWVNDYELYTPAKVTPGVAFFFW
jgi:hypothetical protein